MAHPRRMRDSWKEADKIGAEELAMGTHHGGNGGDPPPDGDRPPDPELPELPPEWGEIAIPDDASSLDAEAERVREELAHESEPGRPTEDQPSDEPALTRSTEPAVGPPLLIMGIAVVVTLVSLVIMTWSGSSTRPESSGSGNNSGITQLPPITLTDHTGQQVALTAQSPMALLLVEQCSCDQVITATVDSAPPGVQVVTVGNSAPPSPAGLTPTDPAPLRLADPAELVRARLDLGPPAEAATVVLVDDSGAITHTVPAANSAAQFQGELTNLTG